LIECRDTKRIPIDLRFSADLIRRHHLSFSRVRLSSKVDAGEMSAADAQLAITEGVELAREANRNSRAPSRRRRESAQSVHRICAGGDDPGSGSVRRPYCPMAG
jgi:hypothetical protein